MEFANFSDDSASEPTSARRLVLTAIAGGFSRASAAQEAGVTLEQVEDWLRDPGFVADLNAYRADVCSSFIAHGARLTATALESLEDVIEDDPKLALEILKESGVLKGIADPEAIPDAIELQIDAFNRVARLKRAKMLAELGLTEEEWRHQAGLQPLPRNRRESKNSRPRR